MVTSQERLDQQAPHIFMCCKTQKDTNTTNASRDHQEQKTNGTKKQKHSASIHFDTIQKGKKKKKKKTNQTPQGRTQDRAHLLRMMIPQHLHLHRQMRVGCDSSHHTLLLRQGCLANRRRQKGKKKAKKRQKQKQKKGGGGGAKQ